MLYVRGVTDQVSNALRKTYDSGFPEPGLRNIYVGPEFQLAREKYPAIYVTFQENTIQPAGLGWLEGATDSSGQDGIVRHWLFQGSITFTVMALTPLSRDTMADWLVNMLGNGDLIAGLRDFHNEVFDPNDFIILYMNTQNIIPGGPGVLDAPWGTTEERLYYRKYTVNVAGEFYSDISTGALIEIRRIASYPYRPDQTSPTGANDPADWR